jgi:ribosome-binding factor A
MSDPKRVERVRSELSAVLAEVLLRGVKDPRVGNVSITDLRLSPDLKSARVRFLSLGGQKDLREVKDGLKAASGWLRREIGKRMRLRVVPDLVFEADTQFDRAVEVTRIIEDLEIPPAEDGADEVRRHE